MTMDWTYCAFQRWRRIFLLPRFFPVRSRCSMTMQSTSYLTAISTMNCAVFTAMSSLIPFACAHSLGVRPAQSFCACLMWLMAWDRESYSLGRDKNSLPRTVPSASMTLHVHALFNPKSTARIRSVGFSDSFTVVWNTKSRNHSHVSVT